ncbi:MAG TPA: alpha-glucosidase C-terminal domain-containing protein, partial [Synergistales bacterium]|nr:alpha-glucosidase C-terminal domain-containing protein [Synergistales bacterium]
LAPLLENNRRKQELMNFLLLSLPGTPVFYYGDEIGMGDNYFLGDRDGVRTPMQWSPDRNAGFSKANPQTLYLPMITDPNFHYKVINVENQETNPSSLLWWMRRSIAIRRRYKAFSRGHLSFVKSDNPRVVAFTRTYGDQILLIVANLSRFSQVVNMELRDLQGYVPEELSSGNTFLQVSERPYTITMGPHGYFAFQMLYSKMPVAISEREPLMSIRTSSSWRGFLSDAEKSMLESDILPSYVRSSRWFLSKQRRIRRIAISNIVRIPLEGDFIHLSFIKVQYPLGSSDMFLLPLSFAQGEKEQEILNLYPEAAIAEVFLGENRGILYDGCYDKKFHRFLYKFLSRKRKVRGKECEL